MITSKIYRLNVTWRGPFPIDMLRHDYAWPRQTEDGARIAASFVPSEGPGRSLRECELVCLGHPTVDRWRSFGCGVRVMDENGNEVQ
jgi:hypothetical protein